MGVDDEVSAAAGFDEASIRAIRATRCLPGRGVARRRRRGGDKGVGIGAVWCVGSAKEKESSIGQGRRSDNNDAHEEVRLKCGGTPEACE